MRGNKWALLPKMKIKGESWSLVDDIWPFVYLVFAPCNQSAAGPCCHYTAPNERIKKEGETKKKTSMACIYIQFLLVILQHCNWKVLCLSHLMLQHFHCENTVIGKCIVELPCVSDFHKKVPKIAMKSLTVVANITLPFWNFSRGLELIVSVPILCKLSSGAYTRSSLHTTLY